MSKLGTSRTVIDTSSPSGYSMSSSGGSKTPSLTRARIVPPIGFAPFLLSRKKVFIVFCGTENAQDGKDNHQSFEGTRSATPAPI